MASLLGGEYCIHSLRQDVSDLQTILDDVHSRVGLVRYQSWKFPDKSSCDVDIKNLLDRCQHNKDDDEECQMSHIMLYDLVIDRLVYLLQSFMHFNEILLNVKNEASQNISPVSRRGKSLKSMSIGLTTKQCWERITQIAVLLQRLAKEVSAKPSSAIKQEEAKIRHHVKPESKSVKELDPVHVKHKEPDNFSDKDISRDVRTISCQTYETAYSTCEICSRTQNCLNDVGRTIIDLCKSQNLPTALEDYQARYKESVPMSLADLVRWGKHQSKDLSRICRHMSHLVNQVTPLKADLATLKKSEQQARSELKQCQSVYERKEEELREEFRRKEYILKENEKDLKRKISTLESIRTGMQEEIDKCHWQISELKDELLQKHRNQLTMETGMSQLKEEAIEGQQYKKDALKFKTELSRVQEELDETKNFLNHNKQLYERELTKNENVLQHEKMLQEKQKNLLSRMENITEDCEKLREQILTLEEERDVAIINLEEFEKNRNDEKMASVHNNAMEHVQTDEVKSLQQSLEILRSENEELRSTVNHYIERERLIVAYPDLNQANVSSPMVQGSGDIFLDMQKQIEANDIRKQILEKENEALQKTLQKVTNLPDDSYANSSRESTLETTTYRSDSGIHIGALQENLSTQPIQLWKRSDLSTLDSNSTDGTENSPEAIWYRNRKSRSPSDRVSARSQTSKPPSGRQKTMVLGLTNEANKHEDVPNRNGVRMDSGMDYSCNSLEAYKKMKQQQHRIGSASATTVKSSFTVGSGKRPTSGRPSSAKSAMFKPWT
ncbi:coiled-coil domain-containing protein 157-like [Styela clava]